MNNKQKLGWEITIGVIPGILFGVRSYIEPTREDHVLYIGFIDICLTNYYEDE
jgi:hypothetical protein